MFHLGESQELYVVKEVGFGIYLGEEKKCSGKSTAPKKKFRKASRQEIY